MSNLPEITRAINEIGDAFEAFKGANDERLDQIQERLEEIESRGTSPGKTSGPNDAKAREHLSRFTDWLRKPADPHTMHRLSEFEHNALEHKDVTIGAPAGGGYAVPEVIAREIERLELHFSPVRRLVKVTRTSTSDYKELVNIRGATAAWVSETGNRTGTDTPQLRERVPSHGELYAYPTASNWSLDDIFFNVGQWLAEEVAQAFAVAEGDAVIRGDSTNKPTGLLNTTPVTTADFASPMRDPAAFKYLASSTGSPAVAGIDADVLIDTVYDLNAAYRAGASWTMNSQTAAHVMKLRDSMGRFLWTESLVSGQPPRLLGHPVEIWEQMDDIGSNNFPIAFGNFRRAYVLTDRHDIRITRDEITVPGLTKFYVRKRVGGTVLNNQAVRWIRTVDA